MNRTWQNRSRAARYLTTDRPLTRSLELSEEGLAMQATRICSVAECDKPCRAKGYCAAHYSRWRTHGDPTKGRRPTNQTPHCTVDGCNQPHRSLGLCGKHRQRLERTGTVDQQPFVKAACSITGCEDPVKSWGWCNLHYERWVRNGDPLTILPNPGMLPGAQNAGWKGDDVGYTAAHDRVRAAGGTATANPCADCGSPAHGWSYDHLDPDEKTESANSKKLPYSVKLEHYQPRCNPCHWKLDHPTGSRMRA